MKETAVLLGGFGFMTLAVVVLANFGHVEFAFFSQDPRWWSLPLSIAAAVVALAVALAAMKWSRSSKTERPRRGLSVFLLLLFGAFLFLPLFWLLAMTVGTAAFILVVPYDLAVVSATILCLSRLGAIT